MGTTTSTETITRPQVRARLGFSETLKEGWRYESTIELTFDAIDEGGVELHVLGGSEDGATDLRPWSDEMERLIAQAHQVGQAEVDRLNALRAEKTQAAKREAAQRLAEAIAQHDSKVWPDPCANLDPEERVA